MGLHFKDFLKKDFSRHEGEWIAISGARVIAHGKSISKVIAKARKNSKGKEYAYAKVPKKSQALIL
ncbi:MAG: hypothetical protein HY392_05600 [Candidatus Diapherotrites archaeon]|nr:hypothetical protein [Candidatus Diapherotrites archaeon]